MTTRYQRRLYATEVAKARIEEGFKAHYLAWFIRTITAQENIGTVNAEHELDILAANLRAVSMWEQIYKGMGTLPTLNTCGMMWITAPNNEEYQRILPSVVNSFDAEACDQMEHHTQQKADATQCKT